MKFDLDTLSNNDLEMLFLETVIDRNRAFLSVETFDDPGEWLAVLAMEARADAIALLYLPRVKEGWEAYQGRLPRAEMRAWLSAQTICQGIPAGRQLTVREVRRLTRKFELLDELNHLAPGDP